MTDFTIYWRHGETSTISGDDIASAFSKAGYGGGAIRAIDFYAVGTEITHSWNKELHEWERIIPIIPVE